MKIAFISSSHHKKSEAFDYIVSDLSTKYNVSRYWDEEWIGGDNFSIDDVNNGNYECLVFAQVYPKPELLKKLKCKNILWLPMYDSEVNAMDYRYLKLIPFGIKVISFSKLLHTRLVSLGMDSTYLQMYIKPLPRLNLQNKYLKVFFWSRHEYINWELVKALLGEDFKGEIILQNVPDPKNTFIMPSDEDIKKYNIKLITEWLPFEKIIPIRNQCDIIIAPRMYEGIGLTFIECMSGGVAVISPNTSTMNEYIKDGYNGYLYDINKPQRISFENIHEVKENAFNSMKKGYDRWVQDKKVLIKIVERNVVKRYTLIQLVLGLLYVYVFPGLSKLKKKLLK